jgi:UDP-glucose 4-epimerase
MRLGEDHRPETHLIPIVVDAARNNVSISIFGDDYNTPDGTCIRDYIHISDLVDAHIKALDLINDKSVKYNLGTGIGCSVKEIIKVVEKVSKKQINTNIMSRRLGDPPILIADSSKFINDSGWQPKFIDIEDIITTTWNWRNKNPNGYS